MICIEYMLFKHLNMKRLMEVELYNLGQSIFMLAFNL